MTKVKPVDVLAVIISLIPFILFVVFRDSLAERIPIHWNVSGEVDGWARREQLPMFLAVTAAFGLGMYLLLRFSKKLASVRTARINEGTSTKIGIGMVVFLCIVNVLILTPISSKVNMATAVLLLVSLLFTFLGNLMYNIKPNYLIGIRLPWTLADENNWKQTHRLAGIIWFAGGIISAALSMLLEPKSMFAIFIVITALLVLVPGVYSFVIFKRNAHHNQSH